MFGHDILKKYGLEEAVAAEYERKRRNLHPLDRNAIINIRKDKLNLCSVLCEG